MYSVWPCANHRISRLRVPYGRQKITIGIRDLELVRSDELLNYPTATAFLRDRLKFH